jgi:hypothetical protein
MECKLLAAVSHGLAVTPARRALVGPFSGLPRCVAWRQFDGGLGAAGRAVDNCQPPLAQSHFPEL